MTATHYSSEPTDEELRSWEKARILGACMERARRLYPVGNPDNEKVFVEFVNSLTRYADNHKICPNAIFELRENFCSILWEDLVIASNEQGLWEVVMTPTMKAWEVMES